MSEPVETILAAGGVVTALGAFAWGVRSLARTGKRVADLHDDFLGEPPRQGLPEGRPGVLDRLARIESELSLNGGRSVKDTVNRIDQRLVVVERKLEEATRS